MTVDEFLAWDGGGHVGKLELIDGLVRAMAPASATHAIIQGNIVTAINNHLRAKRSACRAGTEAPVVPPMGKRTNARAPDVGVTCSPPSSSGTFDDPILIVEVISPSNEAEIWESIRALAGLQSLKEILVVQSTEIRVELFRRSSEGAWPGDPETAAADGAVRLDSIGLMLPVAEIYQGTHLV
jgi:Uma2 family endonuclease